MHVSCVMFISVLFFFFLYSLCLPIPLSLSLSLLLSLFHFFPWMLFFDTLLIPYIQNARTHTIYQQAKGTHNHVSNDIIHIFCYIYRRHSVPKQTYHFAVLLRKHVNTKRFSSCIYQIYSYVYICIDTRTPYVRMVTIRLDSAFSALRVLFDVSNLSVLCTTKKNMASAI